VPGPEGRGAEMRKHRPCVQVDRVPTERPQDGGAGIGERLPEMSDLLDPVAQVILVQHLS
jgi:hypothetical protein